MNDGSDTIDLFCPSCKVHVEAKVIGQHVTQNVVLDIGDPVDNHYKVIQFTFATCNRCETPMLASQDFYEVPGEISVPQTEVLVVYPQELSMALKTVPETVARPYRDAFRSYQVKLYDPCVIMCRKCVEAVCNEHGESKGPLPHRLERLQKSGVIDKAIFGWANELRLAGNVAAHLDSNSQISERDAKDALEFARALLLYVFELQNRLQAFRKRRNTQE